MKLLRCKCDTIHLIGTSGGAMDNKQTWEAYNKAQTSTELPASLKAASNAQLSCPVH